MKIISIFLIILLLSNCTEIDKTNKGKDNIKNEKLNFQTNSKNNLEEKTIQDLSEFQVSKKENLNKNEIRSTLKSINKPKGKIVDVFPNIRNEEIILNSKLLLSGNFHGDEVKKQLENKNWFGLFINSDGNYYLRKTPLITKPVFDPMLDEESKKPSGINISTTEKDSVILLISGLNHLINSDVKSISEYPKIIQPDNEFKFSFSKINYRLFAKGEKETEDLNTIKNYELFLENLTTNKISLISSFPFFEDSIVEIMFIGDINQDGYIDLIIDNSPKYNSITPTLYLSTKINNKEQIKIVGIEQYFGC